MWGLPHEAMNDGDVREIKGNFLKFVEYIKCANIENAIWKKGSLSNIRSDTCSPITIWMLTHPQRNKQGLTNIY